MDPYYAFLISILVTLVVVIIALVMMLRKRLSYSGVLLLSVVVGGLAGYFAPSKETYFLFIESIEGPEFLKLLNNIVISHKHVHASVGAAIFSTLVLLVALAYRSRKRNA